MPFRRRRGHWSVLMLAILLLLSNAVMLLPFEPPLRLFIPSLQEVRDLEVEVDFVDGQHRLRVYEGGDGLVDSPSDAAHSADDSMFPLDRLVRAMDARAREHLFGQIKLVIEVRKGQPSPPKDWHSIGTPLSSVMRELAEYGSDKISAFDPHGSGSRTLIFETPLALPDGDYRVRVRLHSDVPGLKRYGYGGLPMRWQARSPVWPGRHMVLLPSTSQWEEVSVGSR